MACEVKTFGNIQDFRKVQEYFGLGHGETYTENLDFLYDFNLIIFLF